MQSLIVTDEILRELWDERGFLAECRCFLNEAIDAELERGDEMDEDLIDACADALLLLQAEDPAPVILQTLESCEKLRRKICARSAYGNRRRRALYVACACAVLLVAAGTAASQTATGERITRSVSEKIAALFGMEETTLPAPEHEEPAETQPAVTEPVTQTPSEPAESTTRAVQKAATKEVESGPARMYGVFPDTLKTEYLVGEKLDMTGVRVMIVYSDGSEREVPLADCTVQTGSGFSQDPGKYTVTVFYEGLSFSYGVTVNAVPESVILNSIYGVFPPDYTFTVSSFEDIDLSGMTVKAVYSDGSERTLTPEEYEITIERNFMDLENKALVTVSYSERAFSFILTKEVQ